MFFVSVVWTELQGLCKNFIHFPACISLIIRGCRRRKFLAYNGILAWRLLLFFSIVLSFADDKVAVFPHVSTIFL